METYKIYDRAQPLYDVILNMLFDLKLSQKLIKIDLLSKLVSQFDQEIPQLQTWHRKEEPYNNYETPGRPTKQSNQLSLSHQDDCKTRMVIK